MRKPVTLFSSIPVQGRIALVSVSFIIGLTVIGGVSFSGQQTVKAAMNKQADYAALTRLSQQVRALSLTLKSDSRDIRFRRATTDADGFKAVQDQANKLIGSLDTQNEAGAFRQQIGDLSGEMAKINTQFGKVASLLNGLVGQDGVVQTRQAVSADLDDKTLAASREADSTETAKLLGLVREMRRAEADYQATTNDEDLGAWEVASSRYARVLAQTDLAGDARADLSKAAKAYAAAFSNWTDAEKTFVAEAEQLTGDFDLIGPKLQAFEDAVSASAQASARALDEAQGRTSLVVYATILSALAVGLAIAIFVGRTTAVPLRRLRDRMLRLADGETRAEVPFRTRRDEIGEMAKAVEIFRNNGLALESAAREKAMLEYGAVEERARNDAARQHAAEEQARVVDSLAAGLDHLTHGNLTWTIDEAFAAEYEKLRSDFNTAMGQMRETMRVIAGSIDGVRNGAGEISTAAGDLSGRTEKQAGSLAETAATLDQITATVQQTAQGATLARSAVDSAAAGARASGQIAHDTINAMQDIATSSRQISQIIGVIDEIAFQTNLLALNAGVEAARAGESGAGFAVIASEVRALAQRSAEAAREIKQLIVNSGSQVEHGVRLVCHMGEAIGRISQDVEQLGELVSHIDVSAREQATGLHDVNVAIGQIDQVTQQNAAMVEQTTAVSHTLATEVDHLVGLVGRFRFADAERARPLRRSA